MKLLLSTRAPSGKIFAAACSASGVSDFISLDGDTRLFVNPKYYFERQQGRMDETVWQVPQEYIKNSPILRADKVTTPLLLMANKGDSQVPFSQGIELFTALRRLGKKVWLLQYDKGDHGVGRGKDAMDYSIRMMQFFDHYLKGAPAPEWMVRGIPARLKGIDDGLELMPGKEPPDGGLLIDSAQSN